MKSILAVDCGSSTTTAVLIEKIDNEYRLQAAGQAPSTYELPWVDITWGVQEAVRHVENTVGRTIMAPAGWPITPQHKQQGVDLFVVVSSAGPPLRIVIAGLIEEISLSSAHRAAISSYSHITDVISLDAENPGNLDVWIEAIQGHKPDLILMVGGTDDGAQLPVIEMARAVSMALTALRHQDKPDILYAGNAALRPQMADILGTVTQLTSVSNVRPRLDSEDLLAVQAELEKLAHRKLLQLPGFENLSGWTQHPMIPASKSFERLVAFMGRHNKSNVLGVNVGSRTTIISSQNQEQLSSIIRSDIGTGYSLPSLLKATPIEKFRRWLPFEISTAELHNRLLNKSLYPNSTPTTKEDLWIEQAVARESIRQVVEQSRSYNEDEQWNMIIGAGRALTGIPLAAQSALVLIDAVEPWGVTNLVLDKNGLVNVLGAIATIAPAAAVNALNYDTFLSLGTVVAPAGHGSFGKPALKIKVSDGDQDIFEKEIAYGSIKLIPLAPGKKVTLEIHPTRHFDIGLGQPGKSAVTKIEGGALGLIVDARGRPLRLPVDDLDREELLQQWFAAIDPTYETPESNH